MNTRPMAVVLFGTLGVASADPAKTEVTFGAQTITGAVQKGALHNALQAATSTLLACYDGAAAKARPAKTSSTVTFTIGSDGKVSNASATGSIGAIDTCIAAAIKGLTFGKLSNGKPADVSLTLTFGPGQGYGGGTPVKAPTVTLGAPSCGGPLDHTVLRRVVRRFQSQLTYCYEKQLLVNAALEGTVIAKFDVDTEGKVGTATAAGVDKEIEACVAKTFQRMTFPRPSTGGIVTVTYPITYARPAAPKKK